MLLQSIETNVHNMHKTQIMVHLRGLQTSLKRPSIQQGFLSYQLDAGFHLGSQFPLLKQDRTENPDGFLAGLKTTGVYDRVFSLIQQ